MFTYIVLDCIQKISGERTVYNIYHLLTAKKATQTIQDSNLFELTGYYGIDKSLRREDYDLVIQSLAEQGYIQLHQDQTAILLQKGESYLQKLEGEFQAIICFDGTRFHQSGQQFANHLLLFVQTLTYMHQKQTHFIPIIEDAATQQYVKQVWYHYRQQASTILLKTLYRELYQLLNKYPADMAGLFVDHLTTRERVGLSTYQIAEKYKLSLLDVSVSYTNIIHDICRHILDTDNMSLLSSLYPHRQPSVMISESAKQTQRLLSKNLSMAEIAAMRKLKINTVMDHIIEIAYITNNFHWQPYVSDIQYQQIKQVLQQLTSRKLKNIKERLPEEISYFQIQLVMALEK
ncbi:YpbB family protein [Gracilibacillus alcaliphilus]|uniref:helix-turn-helix domain-containing protein n=1 Tax=Gracilibacillus alcaliphilus TaxID=1401441 RepID=UPI00195C727D|nr:helix-turn-helix domain-containing protein [Gracilibacillus alcaliphilus]MBM7675160.1 uncharacterized protein YpbB [Gracilibacillus alcaliphilus]